LTTEEHFELDISNGRRIRKSQVQRIFTKKISTRKIRISSIKESKESIRGKPGETEGKPGSQRVGTKLHIRKSSNVFKDSSRRAGVTTNQSTETPIL
jgi:hypothetical protein